MMIVSWWHVACAGHFDVCVCICAPNNRTPIIRAPVIQYLQYGSLLLNENSYVEQVAYRLKKWAPDQVLMGSYLKVGSAAHSDGTGIGLT